MEGKHNFEEQNKKISKFRVQSQNSLKFWTSKQMPSSGRVPGKATNMCICKERFALFRLFWIITPHRQLNICIRKLPLHSLSCSISENRGRKMSFDSLTRSANTADSSKRSRGNSASSNPSSNSQSSGHDGQRSKKKKVNQKTLGVAWGSNSRSSSRSSFRSSPFSDFGRWLQPFPLPTSPYIWIQNFLSLVSFDETVFEHFRWGSF